VVGNNHKRSGRGQMLHSRDFNFFGKLQNTAHPPPPEGTADEADETTFTFD
jgi:hypothetical protein